ncbi:hypothetical protein ARMGADRAFT_1075217 [Armillaria gallica]|uniref:Uncharacterized protein n=1 Tax=Armillaria gallica TaxID=47427 RepID=A0A2H3ED10_ARMGA|nr:hypothetical protein ARMGADRAFT_1075217 [Armillaria gallica]
MVVEQTQLPREDIYVIYIHKASSGDYTSPQPVTAGAPTAPSTPATAPTTDDMPEWATWDRLFLESIKPMASLFDESYNEAFKIYAAVMVVMGIACETITADKKHIGMGKDSRLPGVLAWLKARVGVHKLTIFDHSPKTFEHYLTFWNWVQQLSLELSESIFGESEYNQDRSKILDMLIVWQKVPISIEADNYECMLDGLKNALSTYLITTGHPHGNWNGAVAYPPGVHSLEWTSLCYEMLYVAAFPHMNPGQESKIKFFCKVWRGPLPEGVAKMVFLPTINNNVGGCIVNVDYELSNALEAMASIDLTEILHKLTVYRHVDDVELEYALTHNWVHAELLNAIEDGTNGLPEGVAKMVFLPTINNNVGGCIVNVDYELSNALEAMASIDLTEILHKLTVYRHVDDVELEYALTHNWVHAELLNAIEDGTNGLV